MHIHFRSPRFLVLSVVALGVMICFTPRRAAADPIVTYMGNTYDISLGCHGTFTVCYPTTPTTATLPWWGDQAVAEEFAQHVGGSLGFPNGANGPLFAYETLGNPYGGTDFFAAYYTTSSGVQTGSDGVTGFSEVWATATLVPEPGTLTLLFAGLLALGLVAGVKRYRGGGLPTQVSQFHP